MEADVVIIGGGFSGTALAIQLLRRANKKLSIALIGRDPRMGRGVAYGTTCKTHLLNVPAAKMTALPGEPAHFTEWLANSRDMHNVDAAFLPRSIYGDYMEDTLCMAQRQSQSATFTHVVDTALSLHPQNGMFEVKCLSGRPLLATQIVLATGNYPPPDPPEVQCLSPERYISYPWAANALDGVEKDEKLLILGSGLTSIDQVLSLTSRGFDGTIFLLSSRGLLPRHHSPSSPRSLDGAALAAKSTRALFAAVRREMERAMTEGADWRSVVDSLRPHSHSIWNGLPVDEKRRFLRHLRSLWDVCRHRISPAANTLLAELIAKKRLVILAGRCRSIVEEPTRARVLIRPRGGVEEDTLYVDRVINCTGPSALSRLTGDPLLRSMLESGLAGLDPIGIGLNTDRHGALIDGLGRMHGNLFAMGPLRKGSLWETTAVPEIRVQAQALAEQLLAMV